MYDYDIHCIDKTADYGVFAKGLGKRFDDFWALKDLDLAVPKGSVLGLLGHNGAGKTTTIRILTTLAQPTEGLACVAGFNVVRQAEKVRRQIGVAGQHATVDALLTARQNLEMIGRLNHLRPLAARQRAAVLLERVGLSEQATQLVQTLSGGMRRRVDLAASLVADPAVLFLDEPTTGLDPRSRNELWEMIRERVDRGTTVVLTTQYLEEADRVADNIVVLDRGRVAAAGTPKELKRKIGGDWISVTVANPEALEHVKNALSEFVTGTVSFSDDQLEVGAPVRQNARLIDVVRSLDSAGVDALDVRRREATLDDVFLTLTQKQEEVEMKAAV